MELIKLFVLAKGFAMLTTKEAAELLGITPRRVQELIKNGALTARRRNVRQKRGAQRWTSAWTRAICSSACL